MDINTAVVPVAGWGTRLLPLTQLVAKEFFPVGRKPAIQHIAEELARAGIQRILFVASSRKMELQRLFSIEPELAAIIESKQSLRRDQIWSYTAHADVDIQVVLQPQQLGLGHAVLCAQDWVGDQPFVVALGDCLIGLPGQSQLLSTMKQLFLEKQAESVIAFQPVDEETVQRYGIAHPSDSTPNLGTRFQLADLVEKPRPEDAPSRLAICGRYILSPSIFSVLQQANPGAEGEIQLTDAIASQIRNGATSYGVQLEPGEKRYDVGDIQSYVRSFVEFALADPELRSCVEDALAEPSIGS